MYIYTTAKLVSDQCAAAVGGPAEAGERLVFDGADHVAVVVGELLHRAGLGELLPLSLRRCSLCVRVSGLFCCRVRVRVTC